MGMKTRDFDVAVNVAIIAFSTGVGAWSFDRMVEMGLDIRMPPHERAGAMMEPMMTEGSDLEIYFAILPAEVDDERARELAAEKAREHGLIPTGDIEIRVAMTGGREVRMADVVCKKPKGWDRNLDVTAAPLFRGLIRHRRGAKRNTGQPGATRGKGEPRNWGS